MPYTDWRKMMESNKKYILAGTVTISIEDYENLISCKKSCDMYMRERKQLLEIIEILEKKVGAETKEVNDGEI